LSIQEIKRHFTTAADEYSSRSSSGLWSMLRSREAAAVSTLLRIPANAKALDLGCGSGYYTELLLQKGAKNVTAVDFVPNMTDNLPTEHVTRICDDVTKMQLDEKFDVIVAAGVMEFLPSPEMFLSNARRHAKETTSMVLLVPLKNIFGTVYRMYHLRHGFNVNLFTPQTLRQAASDSGWQVEEERKAGLFSLIVRITAK